MKVLFIINPCSGRGKINTELVEILRIFCNAGYEVTTHVTARQGDATEVVQNLNGGYDRIICCGGDGTLNEVTTGLARADAHIPISYIPAGTTNDFARTLNLSTNMQEAAKQIVESREEIKIDIGKFASNQYFNYIASFGLFTSVSYKTQQTAKNALGHMAYIFEGIASISNIEDYKISYVADGKYFEGDYIYGGISNTTSIAGIFKYDSKVVDLSDGLFEVLMIKKPQNPNELMKIVSGVTSGEPSDNTVFDFCKASKIELNMPANIMWTLDGEPARGRKKLVIENVPKKITFVK